MGDDVLSWILPEAGAEERGRMHSLVKALRLLRDDARRLDARRAPPPWPRARAELERIERRELRAALESLLWAHLAALRAPGSFLPLPQGTLAYADAWRALLVARAASGFPPAPGEPAPSVAARLVAASAAAGASATWRELGLARLRHVTGPALEAARRWEARLRARAATGARSAELAPFLAGAMAARLDLGQPARAQALGERHAASLGADPDVRRLWGWSALLRGDWLRARGLLRGAAPARLPLPLAELRADAPALSELLPGRSEEAPPLPSGTPPPEPLARLALGASVAAVVEVRPDGSTRVLALDAAESRLAPGADGPPPPEFGDGAALRARRLEADAPPLAGALGGERTRALLQLALRGAEECLRGWVQVESEHLLLPATVRVARLAQGWERALTERVVVTAPSGDRIEHRRYSDDDPRREFVARLFAALGPDRERRASWLQPAGDGTWLVRAESGRVLAGAREHLGCGGALRRAAAGLPAEHAGERDQALHAGSRSGLVFPLAGTSLPGMLVLEFTRPGAHPDEGRARVVAVLRALEPLWWATSFRARNRELGRADVAWDPCSRFLARLGPALPAAVEGERTLVVLGPAGSGRRTLVRWLRFLRAPADVEAACEPLELGSLALAEQEALARGQACPAFFVAEEPLQLLRQRGRLAPALEQRVEPLPLVVPPLAERRDEIPALARTIAAEVARLEGRTPVALADEALADLWRQPWPGQVSELAALVRQLARAHAGRRLGSAEVRAALASRGLPFRSRLPARPASAADVELALRCTRHGNGSSNLARAARYLGWNVATLAARLRGKSLERNRAAPGDGPGR